MHRQISFIQPGQRQMMSGGDLFACVLIRIANIDKYCTLLQQALGLFGGNSGE
jgi:hypothetical protein